MNLRTFRPSYLFRRLAQLSFERRFPDCPWLNRSAILLLDSWLKPTDRGIEWGSGRSTVWIARRVRHLMSIEDDPSWHARIQEKLARSKVAGRVDYRLVPCDKVEIDEPDAHPYADIVDEVADETLDFALVDGNIRLTCMRRVLPKLKPGGVLVLDNANRYVPNGYLGGHTTVHEPRDQPRTPGWEKVLEDLLPWRWLNTSDGIWDTRFWIKN